MRYIQRRTVDPDSYPLRNDHWSKFWYEKQTKQCTPLEDGLRDCMVHQDIWPVVNGTINHQCNRVLDAVTTVPGYDVTQIAGTPTTTNSATTTTVSPHSILMRINQDEFFRHY